MEQSPTRETHGFSGDGRYNLENPFLVNQADADLWNDMLYFRMDQRGRVKQADFLTPNLTAYSEKLRAFFIRDDETGEVWSVPHDPRPAPGADFSFSVGKADLRWRVVHDSISAEITVVVPRDNPVELWNVKLRNEGTNPRQISLYTYLPIGCRSFFRQEVRFDSSLNGTLVSFFPYYVQIPDYYKLQDGWNQVFAIGDTAPTSYMFNMTEFNSLPVFQSKSLPVPEPREDDNEDMAAIFQYSRTLPTGEALEFNWVFGPAKKREDIEAVRDRYLKKGGFRQALAEAEDFIEKHTPALTIETPDTDFDAFINHWQSRRTLMLARTLRFNMAPQGRNVIQDAMGGSLVDPDSARGWFTRIWLHQHTNGWLPHGMPFAEGVRQIEINSIPHKDINSWGPGALTYYIYETGDESILDESVPFADKPDQSVSIYEHVCLGLNWLLNDRTDRGLCRIGQGDWNDPLNMAGVKEQGESIWLSEALALALDEWAPVCEKRGDSELASKYRYEADKLRDALNSYAWDGDWYVRGFTDEGRPFGSSKDTEGRIFLNAQSWAIMCGAADSDRAHSCINAVEEMLSTPSGPMTLGPAFTQMREDIGKLTQKLPGWNENGSVYCHATTFFSYALYCAGESDKAWKVLRNLLCGSEHNPISRAGQLPIYIPNFYRGEACGRKAGLSSHSPNTGTAAWYYRTVVDKLFGLRAEEHGLRIDPQLPSQWKQAKAIRRWRGAVYEVQYQRSADVKEPVVELDGVKLESNLIPFDASAQSHVVSVTLPESYE